MLHKMKKDMGKQTMFLKYADSQLSQISRELSALIKQRESLEDKIIQLNESKKSHMFDKEAYLAGVTICPIRLSGFNTRYLHLEENIRSLGAEKTAIEEKIHEKRHAFNKAKKQQELTSDAVKKTKYSISSYISKKEDESVMECNYSRMEASK